MSRFRAPWRTSFLLVLFTPCAAGPTAAQDGPSYDLVAPTDPLEPEEERQKLHLPEGFEIQLVASAPAIGKPMNLAFDARGRLWVTSSTAYPYPAEGGSSAGDRVTILDDIGVDGRARSITQFADGLNIPIGLLPLGASEALVYSIPSVDRFRDTDGDGAADERDTVLQTYGYNDTHGMTNAFAHGFDGWIHACHGFANTSVVEGPDGRSIRMQSGNTYRFRPDGTGLEQWTWGQVNPFGLAFDALGNLYSCDCHSKPIYQLIRGAYYPSFGKPHDGLGFGPAMMDHSHGSTGIAGIVVYEADQFPRAYRGTLFIGNPVTSRVNHDRLAWTGSTPRAIEQPDFIVSDDPWFRPVDLELGPDGALYIADFYNRIIGHYEVPLEHPGRDRKRGRVWRVVYVGDDESKAPPPPLDADCSAANDAELIADLSHPNLSVRLKATEELERRVSDPEVDSSLVDVLKKDSSREGRAQALWALERRGALRFKDLIAATTDPSRLVRTHAARLVAHRPDWNARLRDLALRGLADGDPFVTRAAADGLARHPSPRNIRPLLDTLAVADERDTHLVHTLRIALRDQLRDEAHWAALPEPLSRTDQFRLADVAPGVPSPAAAGFLLEALRDDDLGFPIEMRFVEHVTRYQKSASEDAIRTIARRRAAGDPRRGFELLQAIRSGLIARGSSLNAGSRSWAAELVEALLNDADPGWRIRAIELIGALRLEPSRSAVERLLENEQAPEPVRLACLDALARFEPASVLPALAPWLRAAKAPPALRQRAAAAIGRLGTPEALETLMDALPIAPAALQRAIAQALAGSGAGAEALLEAVDAGQASPRLLRHPNVEALLTGRDGGRFRARIEDLTANLPPIDDAIRELIAAQSRRLDEVEPDLERGRAVFEAQCAACHQVGGEGEEIGPQLDGVGIRGPERLIEDILDPNRNVDQAFRASILALADGRILTGLVLREEGEALVIADEEGKTTTLSTPDIEEQTTSALSPMPSNFAEQIEESEFPHLIFYLLSLRERPERPTTAGDRAATERELNEPSSNEPGATDQSRRRAPKRARFDGPMLTYGNVEGGGSSSVSDSGAGSSAWASAPGSTGNRGGTRSSEGARPSKEARMRSYSSVSISPASYAARKVSSRGGSASSPSPWAWRRAMATIR